MLIPSKHSGYIAGIRLYPGGGKGGSSAQAPDPRLIEAQIKSMGIQDSSIQKMLVQSAELAPLQKEQLQFGLDTGKAAYDQSQQDREWMLDRRGSLTGLQNQQVRDAQTFDTDAHREQLAGEATADVNSAFSAARDQQSRGLSRMGVNPNSGRALSMSNQISIAQASASASAANKVRQAARAEGYSLTDRANNSLAGYPAMGMAATGAGAGYGSAGVGLANAGLAGLNSGYGAAGGMAGQMGQNATGMFNAQASYKSAQDKLAADSDLTKPLLGMAGGLAMSYMMPGSAAAAKKSSFSWG